MTASNDNHWHRMKPVAQTTQQVISDRIVTCLALAVSAATMGMLIAALLRVMGLWFW